MITESVFGSFKPYFKNIGIFIAMGFISAAAGELIEQLVYWITRLIIEASDIELATMSLTDGIVLTAAGQTATALLNALQILLAVLICGPLTLGLYRAAMTVAEGGKALLGDYFYFFRGVKRWAKSLVVSALCLFFSDIVKVAGSIGSGYAQVFALALTVAAVVVIFLVFPLPFSYAANPEQPLKKCASDAFANARGHRLAYLGLCFLIWLEALVLAIPLGIVSVLAPVIGVLIVPLITGTVLSPLMTLQQAAFTSAVVSYSDYRSEPEEEQAPLPVQATVYSYASSAGASTDDPASFDVLKMLDNSALNPEYVNHGVLRRTVQKLYKEAVLDISDYESYAGGRSAERRCEIALDGEKKRVEARIVRENDEALFRVDVSVNGI